MPDLLVPFLITVGVLTVTPGPDMLLVLKNGLQSGSRVGWMTGVGCCVGIAVHATLAVLGLSAILAASATAYTVVKLVGAAYLVYLGVTMVLSAWRGGDGHEAAVVQRVERSAAGAFRQGLFTNLLNPKIAILFLTLLPQFVAAGEPRLATTATLAGIFLAIAIVWWWTFSLALGPISRVLRGRRIRRALDATAGTLLGAVGIRFAVDS